MPFLGKSIIAIDFVQQKAIVQFKLYQKSPSGEKASVISIWIKIQVVWLMTDLGTKFFHSALND